MNISRISTAALLILAFAPVQAQQPATNREPPSWPTPAEYRQEVQQPDALPAQQQKPAGSMVYVIQLAAYSSAGSAQTLVSSKPSLDLVITEVFQNGQRWYLVSYGEYLDKPTAERVADVLRAEDTSLSTWVRPAPNAATGSLNSQ